MSNLPAPRPALAAYARLVVAAVFVLIFLGGLVTSWQAGMAVPDWPLSFGSINPDGWWSRFDVRLEHGHRLFASVVGLLVMYLCAWTWRNKWLMGTAWVLGVGLVISFVLGTQHAPRSSEGMMNAGFWFAGGIALVIGLFTLVLLTTSKLGDDTEKTVRWLTYAAFVAVCLQAALGGLRVTGQTGGALQLALAMRVFHGCIAQAFLLIVVAVATLLSPLWQGAAQAAPAKVRRLAWLTVGTVYLQLILGAVMRHLGAGLAIPSFPQASPDGSWLPAQHNAYTDINFTHTRIGSVIVVAHVVALGIRTLKIARGEPRLVRPAVALLALTAIQFILGVAVIMHLKPPTLTTFHVLNGAAVLALSVLLALRLRHFAPAQSAEVAPALNPVTA